jgi:hypothetical protein
MPKISTIQKNQEKREKEKLQRSITAEKVVHAETECAICGLKEDDDSDYYTISQIKRQFASLLHRKCWRYGISEALGMEGPMCPECFALHRDGRRRPEDQGDDL